MTDKNDALDTIRAIDRACEILFFLAKQKEQSLPQIAKGAMLPKSTAFRILRTLEAKRLVALNPVSMTYSLGLGFFRIATTAISQMDIRDAAIPYMRELSKRLGANVNLSIAQEDYRIIIERIESQGPYRLYRYMPIGIRLPLYAGAGGKVILAHMHKRDIDRIIDTQINVNSKPENIDIDKLYKE
ncbi:MAG: IclR family transcriptional regulator, partial [Sphingobacteriia bacterium]|nr:IclR family transcriptional regulator [Sphingobacteriia bacterium]